MSTRVVAAPNRFDGNPDKRWMVRELDASEPTPVDSILLENVVLQHQSEVPSVESNLGCGLVAVGTKADPATVPPETVFIDCTFAHRGFESSAWKGEMSTFKYLNLSADGSFSAVP